VDSRRKTEGKEKKGRWGEEEKGRNSINGQKCGGLQGPEGRNICSTKATLRAGAGAEVF